MSETRTWTVTAAENGVVTVTSDDDEGLEEQWSDAVDTIGKLICEREDMKRTHATALATVQAERKIAEDRYLQVTMELEEANRDASANLILQTICRLPDVLTEGDWQQWLDEHREEWLNDDRAFGGWVSQRLGAALATARADVLREVREKVAKLPRYGDDGFDNLTARSDGYLLHLDDVNEMFAILGGDA